MNPKTFEVWVKKCKILLKTSGKESEDENKHINPHCACIAPSCECAIMGLNRPVMFKTIIIIIGVGQEYLNFRM